MTSFRAIGRLSPDDVQAFDKVMGSVVKPYWRQVIAMYNKALSNPKALEQVRTLLSSLAELYVNAYDGIFRIKVLDGDPGAFEMFQKEVVKIKERYNDDDFSQHNTDIEGLYDDAETILHDYKKLCFNIADVTGGHFTPAPIKHVYRAIEKTAMRAEDNLRFKCSNVYDVVRGALVYDTMSEILVGLQEVCEKFHVVRIKNRFVPVGEAGSSGGWRDVVVNMRVKGDRSKHVLEIQIQLRCLLKVRSELGGHFIYAKYRALSEALEVCDKL